MLRAESSHAISTSACSSSLAVLLCAARILRIPRMTITPTNATQITTITAVMLSKRKRYQSIHSFHGIGFSENYVELITRNTTMQNKNSILKKFEGNNCNILIGTHALLSINFVSINLGLIVVDEEQHFGVAQKEKIRSL